MNRTIIGCLFLLVFVTGCAWFQSKQEKPARELASDGMEAFKKGKYEKAIESFGKLKDLYPFSKEQKGLIFREWRPDHH